MCFYPTLYYIKSLRHVEFMRPCSVLVTLKVDSITSILRIENPCVGGSIPPRATKKIKGLASAKPFFHFRTRIHRVTPGFRKLR